MSTPSLSELTSIGQLDWIVDTDAHVRESVTDLLPYFDDQFAGAKEIVTASADQGKEKRDIYSYTHGLPSSAFIKNGAYDRATVGTKEYDAADKLSEMSDFGINYGILDPGLNLGLMTVENQEIALGLANAYNSWILDQYIDEAEEYVASILVAPHNPEEAAEEIDNHGNEDDMVAVFIPSTGVVPPLGHPRYDPIYEAAEANDLPILLHGANGSTTHMFPTVRRWNETYTENHVVVHPFGNMWHLTTMLVRGVPERFPDLEFVFQEAGIAWVPYTAWRLDDHYLMRPYEFHIDNLPSEYINERFYFTTQPLGHTANGSGDLAAMIDLVGPDSIMYASDLPHTDFDPPEELFDRIKGRFDEQSVRNMMGETAVNVFNLS